MLSKPKWWRNYSYHGYTRQIAKLKSIYFNQQPIFISMNFTWKE